MKVTEPTNTNNTDPEEFLSKHDLSLGPHSQASKPENADELYPARFIGVEVP